MKRYIRNSTGGSSELWNDFYFDVTQTAERLLKSNPNISRTQLLQQVKQLVSKDNMYPKYYFTDTEALLEMIDEVHPSELSSKFPYDRRKYSQGQLQALETAYYEGLDCTWLAIPRPEYDTMQMHEFLDGLKVGVDPSEYADPDLQWWELRSIREQIQEMQ